MLSKKVAVTGANGFVGNNLCRQLLQHGHEVSALVFNNQDAIQDLPLEVFRGSIMNEEDIYQFTAGQEVVFHCAGIISIAGDINGKVFQTNVIGSENVVRACIKNKVKRMIYMSSIQAFQLPYGETELNETAPSANENSPVYDYSKATAEQRILELAEDQLEIIILNPAALFGPYDFEPSLTGKTFIDLAKGKMPALIKGGFDFVDIRDVVDSAINAMEQGRHGERYLLSRQWISVYELGKAISKVSGKPAPKLELPPQVALWTLPFIKGYSKLMNTPPVYTRASLDILQKGKNVSNAKAHKELGHINRPFDTSIKETLAWFEANGKM